MLKSILEFLIIFLITIFYSTQTFASRPIKENSIDLKISYMPSISNNQQVFVSFPGIRGIFKAENSFGGLGGKLVFNHYLSRELAISISAGLITANSTATLNETHNNSVTTILLGIKYFPNVISNNSSIRPYVLGSLGIVFGYQSGVGVSGVGSQTETAAGSYFGVGSDFILGSLIKLTVDAGYNLMSDFNNSIGGRLNYSGAEFALGIGFMF